jgi:hypothetical protein
MLTLGNGPDLALCRLSKISDRNNKIHFDRRLEQECFGASQCANTIAINANLPTRARLIINSKTVPINTAKEEWHLTRVEHY